MCIHAYKITKWRPTQRTAAAVCLELTIALVNSYEDTMDQEYFTLRYESFSCYNHGEYLSHSREILGKNKKMAFSLPHTLCLAIFCEGFGKVYEYW